MVEGEGFEPSKAEPSDLQSDPFGHSGTPPKKWCRHQESNSGPTDYKSVALPTELYRHTIEIKTVFAYNTQSKGCHTIQLRIIIC